MNNRLDRRLAGADRNFVVGLVDREAGRRGGRDVWLATDGLDRQRLSAAQAARFYSWRWGTEKAQADYPSRRRWGGAQRIGYHRRNGVA